MKQLTKAFHAENIKLKHSGIRTTAFLLAAITPLIGIGMSIYSYFTEKAGPVDSVYVFFNTFHQLTEPFINLFYPLIVIVTASRIAHLEHKNNTWQLIETQPVKRAALLNIKFLKAYQICFYSILIFMTGIIAVSLLSYMLYPASDLIHLSIDWWFLAKKTFSLTLGTGFLLAVIYAFSVRFSNSFLSIIVGVGTLLISPILGAFNMLPKWFPTQILENSLKTSSDIGYWLTYNEYLSILATLIIMLLITFWYVYKNQKKQILRNKVLVNYVLPFGALSSAFFFVNHPKKQLPDTETVIKGIVPEKETITAIYLLDANINDTLKAIPVKNQRFYEVIHEDMPLKTYRLTWQDSKGEKQTRVIFSSNDLVDIRFSDDEKGQTLKILGSRIAENSLDVKLGRDLDYIQSLASEGSEINSDLVILLLKQSYKKDMASVDRFYTPDNFKVRDDYAEIIQNELFYKYSLIWERYKDLVTRSNPSYAEKDKNLLEVLELDFQPDENLIAKAENIEYFRYKIYELQKKGALHEDVLSKYEKGIKSLNNPELQTQLSKVILLDQLPGINDLADLEKYEHTFLPLIKDPRYNRYYSKLITDKKRLTSGNYALAFEAITTENEPKTLTDYRGKYVVLDFWASWCGPCLYQADYFEKNAMEYSNRRDVVFISLSIDQKETAWRRKVKLNDKNVVQLYATNQAALNSFYLLNSIPRFLVIDPEGKIVNSSFPFPNDSNFKIMLNQILPKA